MSLIETQSDAFICVDCGCVFQEPKQVVETHGLDSPPYEIFTVCPKCGGSFVEAKRCDHCTNYITKTVHPSNTRDALSTPCIREEDPPATITAVTSMQTLPQFIIYNIIVFFPIQYKESRRKE